MKARVALAATVAIAAIVVATPGASRSSAPPTPAGHHIYSVSISGGNPTRLTTSPLDELSPAMSPDGTTIVFSRGRDLWLMNGDGTKQRMLAAAPQDVSYVQPSWSPDGRVVAFTAWDVSSCVPTGTGCAAPSVMVVRADGSGLRQIRARAMTPRWSPRGEKLVFAADVVPKEVKPTSIFVVSLDGHGPRLAHSRRFVASPSWSPNGRRIVYTRFVANGSPSAVYVVRTNGTGRRRLATGDRAEWSPRGDLIAVSDRGRLSLVRSSGRPRARHLAFSTWFSWSRRGDRLALLDWRLAVIRPNGRSYRVLCCEQRSGFGQDAPGWSPRGDRLFYAFRPDELPPR